MEILIPNRSKNAASFQKIVIHVFSLIVRRTRHWPNLFVVNLMINANNRKSGAIATVAAASVGQTRVK